MVTRNDHLAGVITIERRVRFVTKINPNAPWTLRHRHSGENRLSRRQGVAVCIFTRVLVSTVVCTLILVALVLRETGNEEREVVGEPSVVIVEFSSCKGYKKKFFDKEGEAWNKGTKVRDSQRLLFSPHLMSSCRLRVKMAQTSKHVGGGNGSCFSAFRLVT